MQKKTEIEMERARIDKTFRTLIRLKHSLNADEELNNTLPDTLAEFDAAVANGELKTLSSLEKLVRSLDAGPKKTN